MATQSGNINGEAIELRSHNGSQPPDPDPVPAEPVNIYPSNWKLVMITLGLSLSIFLAALDSTIVAVAVPNITDQFGSIANIAWYGTAYSITNTAFQSVWGKGYKYFKLKPTYLLAILVFEIGNVIAAAAQSSNAVILGRIVAGIGGGGIMTGSFIIIALTVKPAYRAAYMGVLGVTFGVASVAGPLMGGALVDGLSWRACFWINLPIGAIAALLMSCFFSQPAAVIPVEVALMEKLINMDLNGGVLVAGALSCFVMAMHWAGSHAWSSPEVIGSLLGFAALAALFVLNEALMGDKAMIQTHLLRKRTIVTNSLFAFFLAGMYFPLLYLLPIRFQSVDNNSASESGVRLIPLVLGISVVTLLSNVLLTIWHHYNPFLVAGGVATTTSASLLYSLDATASTGALTGVLILAAIGVGLSLQVPMIANQAAVGVGDLAAASSLSLFMENVGTSLFVAVAEAVFVVGLRDNLPDKDAQLVINAGVTQLRSVFTPKELPRVLTAYLEGCKTGYIVSMSCAAAALLIGVAGSAPSTNRALCSRTFR